MPEVESVTVSRERATVYDLEVEEEHCYVAEGVVHHNTLICASLDGVIWQVGSPDIDAPPRHFNCRSTLVPVIDWEGVGIDPPDGARRPSKRYKVEDGELVELDPKQVSQGTDYAAWFRDQPAAVQDEIIGPTRARLFRSGKVDFRDMVTKDNRIISVKDLPGGKEALEAVRGG